MARLAILASGSGSNFQAIAEAFKDSEHEVCCLICDRKKAYAFERADNLGIPSYHVSFWKRDSEEAEREVDEILKKEGADLVALAGFMRILSPWLVDRWENKIINIHPSLLPKYPGAHGIEESFHSGDSEMGITIHYVDKGMDTGPVIFQESFSREEGETLESAEEKIHALEHRCYPQILINKLNYVQCNIKE